MKLSLTAKVLIPVVLSGTVTLVGCSPKNHSSDLSSSMINLNAIRSNAAATPAEKAETMARAGESLLVQTGQFVYANEVFEQALTVDAGNTRAHFYKAALAPVIEMKGLVARLAPYMNSHRETSLTYSRMLRQAINQTPEMRDFWMSGPADIHTEADAQEVLARVINRMEDLRQTLIAMKNANFEISVPAKSTVKCEITETSPGIYEGNSSCNFVSSSTNVVRLNRADFEAAQIAVAGYQTYFTLLNAYDLSGLGDTLQAAQDRANFGQGAQSPEDTVKQMFSNPRFGTLRSNNGYGVMPSVLKDAVLGVRYALTIEKQLCKNGQPAARPGYALSQGVCFGDMNRAARLLAAAETMLKGVPTVVTWESHSDESGVDAVVLNPMQAFTHPVSDLRSLGFEWQNNGSFSRVTDGTLGGIFPNGDFNDFATTSK